MQEPLIELVRSLDDHALHQLKQQLIQEEQRRGNRSCTEPVPFAHASLSPPASPPLRPSQTFTVPEQTKHLTSEQLDTLTQAFRQWLHAATSVTQERSRTRIWLVFLLIRYGGLRLGEALTLNDQTDLDRAASLVHVRGGKARDVLIPEPVMEEIQQVLETPAMYTLRGTVLHLDQGYVRRIFYERASACALPRERLSPRVIRHSRGIELLRGDMPLSIVQDFLGQQKPMRTATYLHFSEDETKTIMQQHLWRETMKKTSARNTFSGMINRIVRGEILTEVELLTKTGLSLVAVITSESTENLGLREGMTVMASIKAPWIIVSLDDTPTSARNHFAGTVQDVHMGAVEAEVVVSLDEGSTVCALLTAQSAQELQLTAGKPVHVLFKAFAVVLDVA